MKPVTNRPTHASFYVEQDAWHSDVDPVRALLRGAAERKDRYMLGLHWPELLIIASLGLLLFGSKKLPELSRSIGKSIVAFKKSVNEGNSDEKLPSPKE